MDFSSLGSTERAESGSWLHLTHPADGSPLYMDGKSITTTPTDHPCEVLVRGSRSPAIKRVQDDHARQTQLLAMKLMKASKSETVQIIKDQNEMQERHINELLKVTVADWRNIVVDEGNDPVPFSADRICDVISHPHWTAAIFRRSADEGALFTNAPQS